MDDAVGLSTGPLAGLQVLDFTRVLSGPFATMTLADLGADVIKVEPVGFGDDTRHWGPPFVGDESTYFMSINRNKRSVVLDLKSEEGRQAAHELAASVDIVVENFRPGVADRLGIGYKELSQGNERLVYASISGYGQHGSGAQYPGYDPIIQARSGLMSITGPADGDPARVGVAIADISSSMWLTIGILSALHGRETTGRGQHVDVALYDSQIAWLTNVAGAWFAKGGDAPRYGTGHPSIVPSETYATRDGVIMIAIGNDHMWCRLANAIESPELGTDERFATNADRVAHRTEVRDALENILTGADSSVWLERLGQYGVPCSRVNTVGEALSDPLLHEREMIVSMEHPAIGVVRSLGCPIKFSRDRATYRLPPPRLGEHTDEVLLRLAQTRSTAHEETHRL